MINIFNLLRRHQNRLPVNFLNVNIERYFFKIKMKAI